MPDSDINKRPDTYVHGHHPSVVRSHARRTAADSAAYLLPHLDTGMSLLDVGCGPGTITLDLAAAVAPGAVIGVDLEPLVIEQACQLSKKGSTTNCSFDTGDCYRLDFSDDSFDVVHVHQVLQHLSEPVNALREMLRVTKSGGILAAREADYAGMIWSPLNPLLDRWMQLYHEITSHNHVEADAGRYLLGWVKETDVAHVQHSWNASTYATAETTSWWGDVWANRVLQSSFREQALNLGLSTTNELQNIADAWRQWSREPNAVFVIPHGEVIVKKD